MANILFTLGRLALVAIFLVSGYNKLVNPAGLAGMLGGKGLPQPMLLAYAAGVAELVLGALVALGWQARLAALALAAFTVVATVIGHPFWSQTGAQAAGNQIHAMKNLAIIGGLLMIAAAGPGRFALGRR